MPRNPYLAPMSDYFILFKDWAMSMGEKHAVDPLLLGSLYLCSKVSLFSFLGFVVRNIRAKKPFLLLLLFASVSFSIPYTYLIIAGRDIPVWVYLLIGTIFLFGAYSIWKKVTEKQLVSEGAVKADS